MRRRSRQGQGAVELALMVPLLFAILFVCVEFAFYFGAIHWDNYAAFSAARAVQVGDDGEGAARLLLDGNVTRRAEVNAGSDRATVSQWWRADLPFVGPLLGNMNYDVTVVLGPAEVDYENFINLWADNNGGGI